MIRKEMEEINKKNEKKDLRSIHVMFNILSPVGAAVPTQAVFA